MLRDGDLLNFISRAWSLIILFPTQQRFSSTYKNARCLFQAQMLLANVVPNRAYKEKTKCVRAQSETNYHY